MLDERDLRSGTITNGLDSGIVFAGFQVEVREGEGQRILHRSLQDGVRASVLVHIVQVVLGDDLVVLPVVVSIN